MNLESAIHPTEEQIKRLIEEYPQETPVVMINILRFKERVDSSQEEGKAAYERYGKNVLPYLKRVGARLLWRGNVRNIIIGKEKHPPHVVLLVEYPSVSKFVEMITNPEYIKIANDRTIALEYGGLLAAESTYKLFEDS